MNVIRKAVNYAWLHIWKYGATKRQHRRYVARMDKDRPVRVAFMAIDVALWRYQYVYDLMAADKRFLPTVVLTPCLGRDQEKDLAGLRAYFDNRNISYIDYHAGKKHDLRKDLDPDIIFYTQPYEYLLVPEYDCRNFYDRLVCYMPYGFNTFAKWTYNMHFCNLAWRLFYPVEDMKRLAERQASNKGRNVRVTGYANADGYLAEQHDDVWKNIGDGKQRKRIIWAPHFTIKSISGTVPPRSNFLWMADLMLRIAREYEDEIQIAFKPHPALISQLYREEGWGRERAEQYYDAWRRMPNTQIETGDYISLFMTSDAMIHDCGSFSVEYHYSQKPTLFMSRDMQSILAPLSNLGKRAYEVSYIGSTEQEIRHFIEDVVIGGNDTMKPLRRQFFDDYLLPPNGKSVARNVVDDIVSSLNMHG